MKRLANFRNVLEVMDTFNNQQKCLDYIAELRWEGKPKCVHCGYDEKIYMSSDNKTYRCKSCDGKFTALHNTIFHGTHIPLKKWFYAIYLFTNNKKGISALQMAKNISITPKSAWFLLQRIRQMMRQRDFKLFGEVEIDETFVGGKNKNRHNNKKIPHSQGRSLKDKTALYGAMEKGMFGRVRVTHLGALKAKGMRHILTKKVDTSSTIHSDEYKNYIGLDKMFKAHKTVNHGVGQYVDGDVHTNTLECFWGHLKKGLVSTYHSVSKHKLFRYCYEFEFRWNTRQQSDPERFLTLLMQGLGTTLNWMKAACPDRRRNV